jgi:hypothetical protein
VTVGISPPGRALLATVLGPKLMVCWFYGWQRVRDEALNLKVIAGGGRHVIWRVSNGDLIDGHTGTLFTIAVWFAWVTVGAIAYTAIYGLRRKGREIE